VKFALCALAFLCASCGTFRHDPPPYRLPPDHGSASGPQIYARDCAYCHGDRAEGTKRGPSLRGGTNGPALTDFVLRTGRMPLGDPRERMRRKPAAYSDRQIEAVTRYVTSLGADGPDVPSLHAPRAPLSHGASLYIENCAACHSTSGFGGALSQGHVPAVARRRSGPVAPNLYRSSPLDVAEAIRTGPGSMPSFDEGVLSERDVGAIVRYVDYLQNADDEGGASIGHVGPVAEGAVGWIVGLGLLLLFSRLLGSRER
jgi:ubiquinol-cytochrome c reductase cytochrome c subunit